nr:uncharacterized protein LOC115269889 [Aedes albopictus]
MEHMRYDRGFVTVKRMPSDGHCLFSALIFQFTKQNVMIQHIPRRVTELHKQVVAYIKSNMENFRESLMDTVGVRDYLGHDADTRVQEFLRRLEESNEWGGEESVAAAANIFKRRIDVYCEDGGIITFNRSDTARGVLRIAYRAATHAGEQSGKKDRTSSLRQYNSTTMAPKDTQRRESRDRQRQ